MPPYICVPAVLRTVIIFGTSAFALPAFAADLDTSKCPAATAWQTAYNKGDATAVAAMYASHAVEVTPQGIQVGPSAVKERVETNLKMGMKPITITATLCRSDSSNSRWSAGEWKGKTPQGAMGGFWTAIEAKDQDGWKIQNLTFNNVPPPAASK